MRTLFGEEEQGDFNSLWNWNVVQNNGRFGCYLTTIYLHMLCLCNLDGAAIWFVDLMACGILIICMPYCPYLRFGFLDTYLIWYLVANELELV